jgi:hypothetical protein
MEIIRYLSTKLSEDDEMSVLLTEYFFTCLKKYHDVFCFLQIITKNCIF